MTPKLLSILDKWQAVTDAATPAVYWYVHVYEGVIKGPWNRWFRIEGPKNALASTKGDLVHGSAESDLWYCATAMNEFPRSIEALRVACEALGRISRARTSDGEQLASHRDAGQAFTRIEQILAGEQGEGE